MGVLGVTTPEKLRAYTQLQEVASKGNPVLQSYIDRAETLLSRLFTYDNTLANYASQMELAANMTAENLIIMDTPTFRRSLLAGFRAEQIGTYSYSRSNEPQSTRKSVTDEIYGIIREFSTDKTIRQSRTEVFVPRTVKEKATDDVRYFIPEDEQVSDTAILDPDDPRIK